MPDAPLKVKNAAELLKYIEDNDIQYIDFNFTDPRGNGSIRHSTSTHSTRI